MKQDLASEIYQKFQKPLKNFIFKKVEREEDVDEILQETIISAVDCYPLFSGKSTLFSWLCGIAKHEIADFYRKKKIKTVLFSHLPFLENFADRALGPEEEFMEEEVKVKIKKVLKKLTEGYEIVLRLRYIDGLAVSQIANNLGLSYKAAESKLSRAKVAFRQAWIEENGNEEYQSELLKELFP